VLFFPYKLDISLYRVPFLTVLVCLVCTATFLSQGTSADKFGQNLGAYCAQLSNPNLQAILSNIDDAQIGHGCASVFLGIRQAKDREATLLQLAHEVRGLDFYTDKQTDIDYKQGVLRAAFEGFEAQVPLELTDRLAYRPAQYDVVTMLTSTFAHGSWGHLLGNLLFFFIFASCVECALGAAHFTGAFVVMAAVTSLAYSHSVAGTEAPPTIGLSGVAMGMMVMLTAMLPRARIWCFFWFLLYVKRFTLPVLVIAAWHVGWNLWDLSHPNPASHINYMAHVSGAATGAVLGVLYRVFTPQRLGELEMAMGA